MMQRLEDLANLCHKRPEVVKATYQRHIRLLNILYKHSDPEIRRRMAYDAVERQYNPRMRFSAIFKN